jgi:PAS domain S-box-containing protein
MLREGRGHIKARGSMAKIEDYADRHSDGTEAGAAEAALQESEAYLEAILDSTADGILAVDNSGKVLKANRRFAELWRIPDALLESRDDASLLAFVLEQLFDPEGFLMKVQSLYGSDATDVGTVIFKDGRIFERHSAATMQGSAVTGRVWSFSDITERSLAEKTLRVSEGKFRSLVENITDVVLRYDLDLRFTYVSPAITSALDMRPADMLGKTHLEAGFSEAHAAVFDDALRRALATKLPVELEFALPGLTREVYSQTRVFPELDSAGRPTSVVSVSRDVTAHRQADIERRRAEAALRESEIKYRTVADNTYDWEWWVAPDGRYIYVSPSCERITGYSAQEFLDDPDLLVSIAHSDDAALLREHVSSAPAAEPSEGCRLVFRIITAAGEERTLEHLCQEVTGEEVPRPPGQQPRYHRAGRRAEGALGAQARARYVDEQPAGHGLSLRQRCAVDHGVRERRLQGAHRLPTRGPDRQRSPLVRRPHAPGRHRRRAA